MYYALSFWPKKGKRGVKQNKKRQKVNLARELFSYTVYRHKILCPRSFLTTGKVGVFSCRILDQQAGFEQCDQIRKCSEKSVDFFKTHGKFLDYILVDVYIKIAIAFRKSLKLLCIHEFLKNSNDTLHALLFCANTSYLGKKPGKNWFRLCKVAKKPGFFRPNCGLRQVLGFLSIKR